MDVTTTTTESTPRKIALIGYAPNVRFAPWGDPSYEIWGLNDQINTMPRIDVLFEIHAPEVIKSEGHWDRLKTVTIPVFMQQHYDEIPTSVAYPMDLVQQRYTIPGCERPFLTCSASLMLAVAVESQPTPSRIDIFGVDMAQDSEFSHQRPSCEFFIGVAHGKGIQLSVQSSSDLLKAPFVYGFEDEKMTVFKSQVTERRKWLTDMLNQAAQKESLAKEERLQYVGAVADIEHVMKRWVQG
jgi:hypothetical protein